MLASRVLLPSKFASFCLALASAWTLSCADAGGPSPETPTVGDPTGVEPGVGGPSTGQSLDVPSTPPQSALSIFGGQTGSEVTDDEAAGPCDEAGSEIEPDAGAPLGVSASQLRDRIAGEWQLQVNGEEPRRFALQLSEPETARVLSHQRGEQCVPMLTFSVTASFEVVDAGAVNFELTIRAESSDVFAAFVEFDTREALGARADDDEVLQLLISQDAGRSVGWLQAAEAEGLGKRRTLGVMLRR